MMHCQLQVKYKRRSRMTQDWHLSSGASEVQEVEQLLRSKLNAKGGIDAKDVPPILKELKQRGWVVPSWGKPDAWGGRALIIVLFPILPISLTLLVLGTWNSYFPVECIRHPNIPGIELEISSWRIQWTKTLLVEREPNADKEPVVI